MSGASVHQYPMKTSSVVMLKVNQSTRRNSGAIGGSGSGGTTALGSAAAFVVLSSAAGAPFGPLSFCGLIVADMYSIDPARAKVCIRRALKYWLAWLGLGLP